MSFDPLAPHYGWMERVLAGEKLHRMRTRWLGELPSVRRALLVGEGNGRFLVELRRQFPSAEILCLDASGAMLSAARRRLDQAGLFSPQVCFVQATWPLPQADARDFDLIATHFFLDCFPPGPLTLVVEQLAQAGSPEANWLLADFCQAERGFARLRTNCLLSLMYGFFRRATRLEARELTPPDPFLRAHGYSLRKRCRAEWGLLHTDWWQRTLLKPGSAQDSFPG